MVSESAVGGAPLTFLDPPYAITDPRLYGRLGYTHRSFDHLALRDTVAVTSTLTLITYNASQTITRMYRGWRQAVLDLGYSMNFGRRYCRLQVRRQDLILRNCAITLSSPGANT